MSPTKKEEIHSTKNLQVEKGGMRRKSGLSNHEHNKTSEDLK